MTRSLPTLIAAGLAFFTAMVHLIAGTLSIQAPLFASNTPEEVRLLLYICWHMVSITLFASAYLLFRFSKLERNAAVEIGVRTIGVCWILFGLLFPLVALVFAGPRMVLQLPQITLLLPVGLLCVGSMRRHV